MEEVQRNACNKAYRPAYGKGKHYFRKRLHDHCVKAHVSAAGHSLRQRKGYGKNYKANRVVHCDHGQQRARYGAVRPVLAHYHKRGRRSRGRGYCAERERKRHVKAQSAKRYVHKADCRKRLEHGYYYALAAYGLYIVYVEFAAYRIGDEAQRQRYQHVQRLGTILRDKVKHAWPYQKARNKITRYIGQRNKLRKPVEQKPGRHSSRNI